MFGSATLNNGLGLLLALDKKLGVAAEIIVELSCLGLGVDECF